MKLLALMELAEKFQVKRRDDCWEILRYGEGNFSSVWAFIYDDGTVKYGIDTVHPDSYLSYFSFDIDDVLMLKKFVDEILTNGVDLTREGDF